MLSVLSLIASAVTAQATPASAAPPPTEKLICKRVDEDTTGSRLGRSKRICRTQAEWRAMDDATARALNKTKGIGLAEPFAHEGSGR